MARILVALTAVLFAPGTLAQSALDVVLQSNASIANAASLAQDCDWALDVTRDVASCEEFLAYYNGTHQRYQAAIDALPENALDAAYTRLGLYEQNVVAQHLRDSYKVFLRLRQLAGKAPRTDATPRRDTQRERAAEPKPRREVRSQVVQDNSGAPGS